MRFNMTREFYIPAGAVKIADKQSSAVAYVYENASGAPCAVAFHGKAAKPDWRFRFRSPAEREKRIAQHFASWRTIEGGKRARRETAKAWENPYKPGDLFRRSWGYEQTNVDWYEVVAVSGKMLTVRELAQERTNSGDMCGKTVPLPGQYVGEPFKCRAQDGRIKINHYAHAYFVAPTMKAGVPIYEASYWSSYG